MEQQQASEELTLRRTTGKTLLERIRVRPPVYLGDASVVTLYKTLLGYKYALMDYGIKDDTICGLPEDFHDWTAYRLHFYETTMGWCKMILERCKGDEIAGLDLFYQLLDEHAARRPRAIARITGIDRKFTRTTIPEGGRLEDGITTEERYPYAISLVAYTEDPGFFVYSDEPGMPYPERPFCPHLGSHHLNLSSGSKLTILDPVTFDRFQREEAEQKAKLEKLLSSITLTKSGPEIESGD